MAEGKTLWRYEHQVERSARESRNGHRGGVVWLTGLSGSGKSTLAMGLEKALFDRGYQVFVLDGDNVRYGLNSDLGFSPADRDENIRRVGEVAALIASAGLVCIAAFISPYSDARMRARRMVGAGFLEVYLSASLAVCESRDQKGIYNKARKGAMSDMTGISAPYEPPEAPELTLDTGDLGIADCIDRLASLVEEELGLKGDP